MRLRTSWVISALGALWLASCGGNNDAGLFSSIPDGSGGANQTAGGAGKSGSNGGASSGGASSGGAASGGASSGGVNNNAGSDNGGTSNNAGSGNGGANNNAGSGNGGTNNNTGSGNGGTNNNGGANNNGGGGSANNGGSPFGGTGGIIVAGNGGAGGSIVIKPCSNNGGCDEDEYCHKNSCAAQASGTCQRRPLVCPSIAPSIVCGCDGYTYLTACLAAANGVNVDSEGADSRGVCGEEQHIHCEDVDDCPDPQPKGAACVDFEDNCGDFREPECWVLPEQCPENDPGRLQVCGIGPAVCVGVCDAAKSGEPFAWDNGCN